jgi:hypothetical protein
MRVIVDENAGPGTDLWELFQHGRGQEEYEFVFLAKAHPGMPDIEILDKLLGPDTILLTRDCVLHMRALQRGCRSYTLNEQGHLTQKRLPGVAITQPLPQSVHSTIQSDYRHRPGHDLTRRLGVLLSERQCKRYRTARRRIRSHFGSAAAICQLSATVGSMGIPRGLLCGFIFHVAGSSGIKGLRGSEGYCLAKGSQSDTSLPVLPVLHALRDQYLLQLDQISTQLFIIPPTSLDLTRQLLDRDQPALQLQCEAARRLLREIPKLTLNACVKGPFHDAMQSKLNHLTQTRSNEVTTVDFEEVARYLLAEPPTVDPSAAERNQGKKGASEWPNS